MRPYVAVFTMQLRKALAYRVDFLISTLQGVVGGMIIPYFLWKSIFVAQGADEIGGYSLPGMVGYYVAVSLLSKLVRGPDFSESVSDDIYEGGLTRYLLAPVAYLPFKIATHLALTAPGVAQLVLVGGGVFLLVGLPGDLTITVATVAMAVVSVLVANMLHYMLSFPLHCLAFWADNVWSLIVFLRFVTGLLGGALLPLSLFPGWTREALWWTPFPHLFGVPTQVLLGQLDAASWAQSLVVGLVWIGILGALGRVVWARGTLQYTGVGI